MASLLYFFGLVGLLGVLEWQGERNWFLTLLLFAPPLGWLLPLTVLTPLCLWRRPRLCGWHALAVLWLLFGYLNWRWSSWHAPQRPALKLVTANIGERPTRPLFDFIKRERPDVFALQDGWYYPRHILAKENPGYFLAAQAEFVLASRFRVRNSGFVPGMSYALRPSAAWFELDFFGRSVVIYVVHMPTPRPEFARMRGRGVFSEMFRGGGIYSREIRQTYDRYWKERLRLANQLMEVLRAERRPFLVAGDFNMPDHGYLCDLFTAELTDVFAAKGRGYGFTFPGASRNPLSLFGPWLRLDYVFASGNWQPVSCRVEPPQKAQQHRAVVATLELP